MLHVTLLQRAVGYDGYFKAGRYTVQHRLHEGGMSAPITREVFEKPDGVVIVPYDPIARVVVMVEQFRTGAYTRYGDDARCWLLELPAGMVDGEETHKATAERELAEETGLIGQNFKPLFSYFSSPGACNEQLHLVYAEVDTTALVQRRTGLADEGEDLLVHLIPLSDAASLIAQRRINDASSILGIQYLLGGTSPASI